MILDRETEVRRLNQSDLHVADAERRNTAQAALLEQLRADGHDAQQAERMLAGFEGTLAAIREHRLLIVDMIRRIDAGEV